GGARDHPATRLHLGIEQLDTPPRPRDAGTGADLTQRDGPEEVHRHARDPGALGPVMAFHRPGQQCCRGRTVLQVRAPGADGVPGGVEDLPALVSAPSFDVRLGHGRRSSDASVPGPPRLSLDGYHAGPGPARVLGWGAPERRAERLVVAPVAQSG